MVLLHGFIVITGVLFIKIGMYIVGYMYWENRLKEENISHKQDHILYKSQIESEI